MQRISYPNPEDSIDKKYATYLQEPVKEYLENINVEIASPKI